MMKNMRRGFTMIELIFVIVIIGILAAVAIPKLAATRDDARISAEVANVKMCLSDVAAAFTATGSWPSWPASCIASNDCFNYLQDTPLTGSLTINANGTDSMCVQVQTASSHLLGVHKLGGASVTH